MRGVHQDQLRRTAQHGRGVVCQPRVGRVALPHDDVIAESGVREPAPGELARRGIVVDREQARAGTHGAQREAQQQR